MKHPDLDMLNNYIAEIKNKPFQWFEHDCLTFTNNAFKKMYGKGWADDWLSKYHKDGEPFKRDKLRKIFNAKTIEEAIDQKLRHRDVSKMQKTNKVQGPFKSILPPNKQWMNNMKKV